MRTGSRGIFPAFYAVKVTKDELVKGKLWLCYDILSIRIFVHCAIMSVRCDLFRGQKWLDGQILGEIPWFCSSAVSQRERCALCRHAQGILIHFCIIILPWISIYLHNNFMLYCCSYVIWCSYAIWLCQQIASNRRTTMQFSPPSPCILEINTRGVKIIVQDDCRTSGRVCIPQNNYNIFPKNYSPSIWSFLSCSTLSNSFQNEYDVIIYGSNSMKDLRVQFNLDVLTLYFNYFILLNLFKSLK